MLTYNNQYQGRPLPQNQRLLPPPLPSQHQFHPPPRNLYQAPPQPYNQYQGAPRPPVPQNPLPGPSRQEQASLLDIESIFTFDPIQPNNPYQAQQAGHVNQPLPGQSIPHRSEHQEDRDPVHGDQASQ